MLVGFQLDVAGAILANIAVTLASALFLVGVLWYIGVWSRPVFDRVMWRRTLKFALPAYGGNVASYLNYRVDEFFIASMLPAEQLAFYVVAVGLVERVWLLPGSVSAALLPHLTNSKERILWFRLP